jgi:hypothetical protein
MLLRFTFLGLLKLRILVYEYFSGGGLEDNPFSASILCEGLSMLKNLISDFKAAGHSVTTILDSQLINFNFSSIGIDKIIKIYQLEELHHIIEKISSSIDAAYIIAPETNEILQRIIEIVKKTGIISLNCSLSGINKVYNKSNLPKLLKKSNIKTPKSINFRIFDKLSNITNNIHKNFYYPVIIKPSKGTNCEGMSIVQNEQEVRKAILKIKKQTTSTDVIAQEFIKGTNVSISLLSSGDKALAISLNKQKIIIGDPHNISEYIGGIVPFESPLKDRAFKLTEKIVESIKGLIGFIGIDLILSNNDIVIVDINPRITTSYVGLKKVIRINLAKALINCVFEKNIPTEIKYKGYVYFFKIKTQNPLMINSFTSNNQIEEVISPFLKISGNNTTCSLISVKGRTKNSLYRKIEKIKRKMQLDVIGGNKF